MQLKTTIAVKVTDIPLYLHNSAFFKSLDDVDGEEEDDDDNDDDDDETTSMGQDDIKKSNCDQLKLYDSNSELLLDDKIIYIPHDVMRDSTSITTLEDFEHLLKTIRFWVIDIVPMTIFHFGLTYEYIDGLKDVIVEYERDLPYLTLIMKVRNESNYHNQMLLISRDNCVELMEYLYLHMMSSDSSARMMTMLWSREVYATTAYYGSFECLQFAFTHGCVVWDTLTCSNAALQGITTKCEVT